MNDHQYPEPMSQIAQMLLTWLSLPFNIIKERLELIWPCNLIQQLSRI